MQGVLLAVAAAPAALYTHVTTKDACENWQVLGQAKRFAFDTETTGVSVLKIRCRFASVLKAKAYYVRNAITQSLRVFFDSRIENSHAAKFDIEVLRQAGLRSII